MQIVLEEVGKVVRPKSINNKSIQFVLEEVGEVVYYIDTWFIAVGVCTGFC